MSGDTDSFVRLAAQDCLARYHESAMPFTALADYLDELRQRGWSEGAISAVAFIVAKSLNANEVVWRDGTEWPNEGMS